MFLRLIEVAVFALVGLFVLTQVILPPYIGKPFFWFFRKQEKKLREKQSVLMDAQTEKQSKSIEKEAEKIKNRK